MGSPPVASVVSGPIAAAALGHHHPRLGAAECVETRAPWCDLLWKNGDLPIKNGDLPIKKW